MIKFRTHWQGGWTVWREGFMVGTLVKYTNNQWSVRGVEPAPFDPDTPIRTHHITWAPTLREAKEQARGIFTPYFA